MKQKLFIISLLLLPLAARADVWQDPETKINYEYTPGQKEASVKATPDYDTMSGSPDAKGDINILSGFSLNGEEYTVTSIGHHAFYTNNITSVHIPNTIKEIADGAWPYTLKRIYISDLAAWCNIDFKTGFATGFWTGAHLFLNGKELDELVIPDGVTEIKKRSFILLPNITSITIPNTVETIGIAAFACSSDVKNVISYIKKPFAIDENTFYKMVYLGELQFDKSAPEATLYVPAGTKALYEATEGWKEFKNIVEMEESEPEFDWKRCDVNGDGSIDVADISTIISAMAAQARRQNRP